MVHAVQDMVEEMSRRYRECFGEVFRFQIMNGTLWVDHISERHNGWYPSKLGPGGQHAAAAQPVQMHAAAGAPAPAAAAAGL